jgi:hypothetical protein
MPDKRWEYKFVRSTLEATLARDLNSLGEEGWEAVGMLLEPISAGSMLKLVLLKRPLQSE